MKPIWSIPLLVLGLVAVLFLLPVPASESAPEGANNGSETGSRFAITDVQLFDGESVTESATVLVIDGKIAEVGTELEIAEDIDIIDGAGKTLLPGLIDAHVHSFGEARADALRFGVTAVIEMFGVPQELPDARQQRGSLDPIARADLFSAGILATAAGGHGTQYGFEIPTLAGPEDAEDWVAGRLAEGSDFIKIVIDSGQVYGFQRPTLDADTVRAVVEAAHRAGVMAVAHVAHHADAEMAIAAGIDGLVHVFIDRPAQPELIERLVEAEVFVIPTAIVMAAMLGHFDGSERIEQLDRLSTDQRRTLGQPGWGSHLGLSLWHHARDNISAMHQAGVPILAGSDAPNPGTAHGVSLHDELVLLVEAGLEPLEALKAATSRPAKHFGLEGRGCIRPGCRADLLLVKGDPLTDIADTLAIETVWKNGHPVALSAPPAPGTETGRDEANLLASGERSRWMASADDFMGGRSQAELGSAEQGLEVKASLVAGFFNPYAGAMWMAADLSMEPLDYRGRSVLEVRVSGGEGPLQLMLFSGPSQGDMPVMIDLDPTDNGWHAQVELDRTAGLDLENLRAIGVFAVGAPRATTFQIESIELR